MSLSRLENESRAAERRCRKIDVLGPLPSLGLVFVYLASTTDMQAAEWGALAACLAAHAILMGFVLRLRRRALLPSIEGTDDAAASGNAASAYRAVLSVPVQMLWSVCFVGIAAIVVVPGLMWALGFEAWIGFERIRSLVFVSLAGSVLGSSLVFYGAKAALADLRASLGARRGDGPQGLHSITRISLRRKLSLAIVLPVVASMLLLLDVSRMQLRSAATERAIDWASLALAAVAQEDGELPLSVRIASGLPRQSLWPVPLKIVQLDADRPDTVAVPEGADSILTALHRAIELDRTSGSLVSSTGAEVAAYRVIDGGRVLVATMSRDELGSSVAGLDWVEGLVCLGLVGLALLIARLAAREVNDGLAALNAAAARLADGDLGEVVAYASEDELGDLAETLGGVRDLLRSTLARLARTADAAERGVAGASAALSEVTSTSASQVELLQHVNQMMGMIHARMDEASHSAEELNRTIEESGSSLLELGATGDELNNTAAVLTSKVDAVSSSLEQMVGSAKQIAGTTDKLSSASEDTSSSMEEMASAMRAVDISAETTAKLSHEVVDKAELGQAKVVQTIEGMEAIREATEVAERVIRGLGARTNEIGGILDVIDDVTDETNLLALNAAIIAAQAGEHGKAFSVVADEIKELADRVLASTKEIGGLIRAVQEESENAIGAIEAGSASVMSGVDLSAEAGRTLEEITVASRESGTRIAEIVASVREQTNAASHVVRLMERVRESAEEIGAAGTEQDRGNEVVYQSAQAMREVALQVRRTTEEQARGFGRIRENVVGVREAVEQITGSLGDQSGACRQVTESLGLVSQGTLANEAAAEKVREAIRELASQALELREDAKRFRI